MDILSVLGVILAFGAVIGGNLMEGACPVPDEWPRCGHCHRRYHCGDFASNLLLIAYFRAETPQMGVYTPYVSLETGIEKVLGWSMRARKNGLLGLEALAEKEVEPFAKKALQLLVDGAEPESIRAILEVEVAAREQKETEAAKVYESMGGIPNYWNYRCSYGADSCDDQSPGSQVVRYRHCHGLCGNHLRGGFCQPIFVSGFQ